MGVASCFGTGGVEGSSIVVKNENEDTPNSKLLKIENASSVLDVGPNGAVPVVDIKRATSSASRQINWQPRNTSNTSTLSVERFSSHGINIMNWDFVTTHTSSTMSYSTYQKHVMATSPTEILPTLFLGSKEDSHRVDRLQELGITHILMVCEGKQFEVPGCKLLIVPMDDSGHSDLENIMKKTFGFIKEAHDNGKLMVHCFQGQNRSPTIVIAWLMNLRRESLFDAYKSVKDRRKIIHPHKEYIQQLREFEKKLHGVYSVPEDFLSLRWSCSGSGCWEVKHDDWTAEKSRVYMASQGDNRVTNEDIEYRYDEKLLSKPSVEIDNYTLNQDHEDVEITSRATFREIPLN